MSVIITFERFFERNIFSLFKRWAYNLNYIKANPSVSKSHYSYILMKLIKSWPKLGDHEQLPPKEGKTFLAKMKSVLEELEEADRGHGGEGAPLDLHLEMGWARVIAEKRLADSDKSPQSVQTALVCWQKVVAIAEETITHLRQYEIAAAGTTENLQAVVKTETLGKNAMLPTTPSSAEHAGPSLADLAEPSTNPPSSTIITINQRSAPPAIASNSGPSVSTSRPKLAVTIPGAKAPSSRSTGAITPKTEGKTDVKRPCSQPVFTVTPGAVGQTKVESSTGRADVVVTPEAKCKTEWQAPKPSKNSKRKRTPANDPFLLNSVIVNELAYPALPGRKRPRTETSRRGVVR